MTGAAALLQFLSVISIILGLSFVFSSWAIDWRTNGTLWRTALPRLRRIGLYMLAAGALGMAITLPFNWNAS
jgi:hypothetical protein